MEKISITGILRTPSGHPYKTRIRVNCISSSIAVPNTFMEYTSDHMGSYSFYLVPGTYNVQVEFNRRFIDFGLLTVKPEDIKEVFNLQELIERTKAESELEENLEKVLEFKKYVLNTLYPIGSIYSSIESKNPGEYLGGTWQQVDLDGMVHRFIRVGKAEDTQDKEDIDLSKSINSFTEFLKKEPASKISANSTALVPSNVVALELEKYIKLDQIAEITDEDIDWILS